MLIFLRYEAIDPSDIESATRQFVESYGPVVAELHSRPLFTDSGLYADYTRAVSVDRAAIPASAGSPTEAVHGAPAPAEAPESDAADAPAGPRPAETSQAPLTTSPDPQEEL